MSSRVATSIAAARLAPVEMPPGMPSIFASMRDVSNALSFETLTHLVDELGVEHARHEARADALDLVRAAAAAREHRAAFRLDRNRS